MLKKVYSHILLTEMGIVMFCLEWNLALSPEIKYIDTLQSSSATLWNLFTRTKSTGNGRYVYKEK